MWMPKQNRDDGILITGNIENPISNMNNSNRDLLVLFNHDLMTPKAIEHGVEMLHEMLYMVENLDNVITAHEVIDVNRYKIFNAPKPLRQIFRQKELKPFVFLNCKN
jgi:hypothetical protein